MLAELKQKHTWWQLYSTMLWYETLCFHITQAYKLKHYGHCVSHRPNSTTWPTSQPAPYIEIVSWLIYRQTENGNKSPEYIDMWLGHGWRSMHETATKKNIKLHIRKAEINSSRHGVAIPLKPQVGTTRSWIVSPRGESREMFRSLMYLSNSLHNVHVICLQLTQGRCNVIESG